ncbi:type II toxin-antitoxin system YafQ family toxin [Acinetobacter sp. YH16052]|uniref:type II toxin-antitoxin system YafQ family toxin n=1 Tax=Acinetobacter sp. YH16052 TaxID=2601191 RepID=UPI0015D43061|nr:type II toxin-antitoxin system YafQ family toxin [Acinetobacter sp. YH16052]
MAKTIILVTTSFKRDIKKSYLELVTAEWAEVLDCLAESQPLPEKYLDHPLKGGAEFKNCRDCHVKPDLVLIYRLVGEDILELHQLDSHSEIFG